MLLPSVVRLNLGSGKYSSEVFIAEYFSGQGYPDWLKLYVVTKTYKFKSECVMNTVVV